MPNTPIYGFPFEALVDQPGHSLHGGLSGTELILAEEIEDELIRIEDDVADAAGAYLTTGWHDITPQGGVTLNAGGTIDIPTGTYDMVKVYLTGSLSGGAGTIVCRVNGDSTADLHESSWMTWNPEAQAILEGNSFTGTSYTVAKWNSNSGHFAQMNFLATDVSTRVPFTGWSHQTSVDEPVRRVSRFSGRLASGRQLASLTFFPVGTGIGFGFVRAWAEGHVR